MTMERVLDQILLLAWVVAGALLAHVIPDAWDKGRGRIVIALVMAWTGMWIIIALLVLGD